GIPTVWEAPSFTTGRMSHERIERPEHAPADLPLWECRDCEQVFWKGSHWDNVKQRLEKLERRASEF
ncbi:Mut7-C RNAse domain-containing protein, partial [Natronocalculus amylovorans]